MQHQGVGATSAQRKHLIKLINSGAVKARGRHLSDDSVAIDESSSEAETEDSSEESDTEAQQQHKPAVAKVQEEEQAEAESIEFSTELAPGLSRQWFGHIVRMNKKATNDKALVVDLDKSDMQNGSKEAFIRLLECADECLGCTHVYVIARRDRNDQNTLMRTFMYLGFKPVAPLSMPPHVDQQVYFCLATEL